MCVTSLNLCVSFLFFSPAVVICDINRYWDPHADGSSFQTALKVQDVSKGGDKKKSL